MTDFINLICPNCGGQLNYNEKKIEYLCIQCSSRFLARTTLQGIRLEEVAKAVINLPEDIKKNNAELAISRIEKRISDLNQEKERLEIEADAQAAGSCAVMSLPLILLGAAASSGFCLFVLFIGIIFTSIRDNPVPWIIGSLTFFGTVYALFNSEDKKRNEIKNKIKEIDAEIVSLNEEINKNEEIIYG